MTSLKHYPNAYIQLPTSVQDTCMQLMRLTNICSIGKQVHKYLLAETLITENVYYLREDKKYGQ